MIGLCGWIERLTIVSKLANVYFEFLQKNSGY
jgi:hypothetical protein